MDPASMLITVGVVATTALIVLTAFALADVLDEDALPAPVARAWLAAITLAPGTGAIMWLRQRRRYRRAEDAVPPPPAVGWNPSSADLLLLHKEIDRFRSRES